MKIIIKDLDSNIILETNEILNKNLSFSNILWSGQSGLNLTIKYLWFDLVWRFIEVFYEDKIIYWWIIYDEKLKFSWITDIQVIWRFDLFNRIETDKNFNLAQEIINYLIWWINQNYINYKLKLNTEWETYIKNISWISSWWTIIRNIINELWYDFFIWADKIVHFKENISEKVWNLSFWADWDIKNGFIWQNITNYVSYMTVISTTDWELYNQYMIDEELEKKYWRWIKTIKENEINIWTISKMIRNGITPPQKKTRIELNYTNFNIIPWDFVTIINSPVEIKKIKIVKVDYTLTSTMIYLDVFSNIYKNLK